MNKVIFSALLIGGVILSSTASAACRLPAIQKSFTTESAKQAYKAKVDKAERCHQKIITANRKKIDKLNGQIEKIHSENEKVAKAWNDFIARF